MRCSSIRRRATAPEELIKAPMEYLIRGASHRQLRVDSNFNRAALGDRSQSHTREPLSSQDNQLTTKKKFLIIRGLQ
jgi:hypothetical protein